PMSELSWRLISKPEDEGYKEGDAIEVLVMNNEKGKVILSPKRLRDNPFKSFIENNKPGDRLDAKVGEILPEGIVVSVNEGLEGFIPSGELSYFRRINNASEIYKTGDIVKTCVLKIDEAKNRVILSIKRLEKNPWNNMEERYPVGARVFGTVKNIVEGDGADIELEENIDAYIHISNIFWNQPVTVAEALKPGEKKEFKIVDVDKSKYRIMVGLKQMHASPWSIFASKYKEGIYLDAKITEIDDTGVSVLLPEGIIGRITIKNRAKLRNNKGDVIKVKINKIEKELKKISITAKDLEATEEQKQLDDYMKSHDHSSFKLNDIINFDGGNKEGEHGK
ncbi:MAG: S1 RNA-binding domain-containing protein, partial [Candidatus Goldiibacteriota bacterium]